MRKYNFTEISKFVFMLSFILLCISSNSWSQEKRLEELASGDWQKSEVIQKEIDDRLSLIKQKIKISSDQTKQMEDKLDKINLKFSHENEQIVDFFKKMDKKAIPKIEKTLLNQDVILKKKALFALGCLLKAPEHRKMDDKQTEEILTLILIRSLKDKDSAIRGHAVSILGGIAYWSGWPGPKPNPAPIVVEALKAMLKDEDASVRKSAAFALYRIDREEDVPEELRGGFKGLIVD